MAKPIDEAPILRGSTTYRERSRTFLCQSSDIRKLVLLITYDIRDLHVCIPYLNRSMSLCVPIK